MKEMEVFAEIKCLPFQKKIPFRSQNKMALKWEKVKWFRFHLETLTVSIQLWNVLLNVSFCHFFLHFFKSNSLFFQFCFISPVIIFNYNFLCNISENKQKWPKNTRGDFLSFILTCSFVFSKRFNNIF